MTGRAHYESRCFWKKITSLARIWHINSYKLYHCLRSEGHQRLAWDSIWPGEASLRRWRSVEATWCSLSCSSLLSAWPGARSLRLLVLVVVSKFLRFLVLVVVSKFQSWNLKAFALRFTPHTVSWQASWQACSLGWVLIETQTNASWRATCFDFFVCYCPDI